MKTKTTISAYILRGAAAMLLFSCGVVALCSAINLPKHPPKFPTPQNNTAFGVNAHESASSAAKAETQAPVTMAAVSANYTLPVIGSPSANSIPSDNSRFSTCSWSTGQNLPSVGVRSVGVFFPANGKFYAMGGRSSDSLGSDFMHPFEYGGNTWTTDSSVTYPGNPPR